jgi:hypothetical protein
VLDEASVSRFGKELVQAFQAAPAPEVNVVNLAPDDSPQHITFERDRQGKLIGAEVE